MDVDPTGPYDDGDVVELTANAEPGWTFDHWSDDLSGSNNPDTITMDGDKAVTATFTQDEYTLTVNVVGQGSVTKNPEQATYHYGDVVELTANAEPGWTFDHWSDDLSGSNNPDTITMDGDKAVAAVLPNVWPNAHGSDVSCSDVAHAPAAPSAHPIPACGTLPVAQT